MKEKLKLTRSPLAPLVPHFVQSGNSRFTKNSFAFSNRILTVGIFPNRATHDFFKSNNMQKLNKPMVFFSKWTKR